MKTFLFIDIRKTNYKLGSVELPKTTKPKFYEAGEVALFDVEDRSLIFKRKSFGCPLVINKWSFYIQDEQCEQFEGVFNWIAEPYKNQLKKERDELKKLRQEVEFLENHIRKYLPDHELTLGLFDNRVHWKPKGRKLVK